MPIEYWIEHSGVSYAYDNTSLSAFNTSQPYLYNDFALVRLAEPLVFNDMVAPACLPDPGMDFTGWTAQTSGWGLNHTDGEYVRIRK